MAGIKQGLSKAAALKAAIAYAIPRAAIATAQGAAIGEIVPRILQGFGVEEAEARAGITIFFSLLALRGAVAESAGAGPSKKLNPAEPTATPPVRPKGRLLPPEEARRKVGVAFNKARESAYPHNEVPISKPDGGKPYILDSYDLIKREIVFRRHTQFSEIQFKTAQAYFREFVKKYPPGSMIAKVPSAKELAGKKLEGRMFFEVPPQWKAIPQAILREAARHEIIIRDSNGRIYHAD